MPTDRALPLLWRHNERDGVLFAQPFVQVQIKKISKLRVTGLCEGNPPVTRGFPSQRASNAENVSIWWRHHGYELWKLIADQIYTPMA